MLLLEPGNISDAPLERHLASTVAVRANTTSVHFSKVNQYSRVVDLHAIWSDFVTFLCFFDSRCGVFPPSVFCPLLPLFLSLYQIHLFCDNPPLSPLNILHRCGLFPYLRPLLLHCLLKLCQSHLTSHSPSLSLHPSHSPKVPDIHYSSKTNIM